MTDTRELSPADALAQLAFLVIGILESRAGERGLSVIQARLLGVLRDREPSMGAIAALLGLDKSSITGLVDRAERRGLVARASSEVDRRAVTVALTDEGRRIAAEVAARFDEDVAAVLDRLPAADGARFTALASRLLVARADARGLDLFGAVPGGRGPTARS